MKEDKRPHFGPKQVRTLKGVKPGHFYYERRKGSKKNLIVALSHPLLIDGEQCFWFAEWPLLTDAGLTPKDLITCAQLSITPLLIEVEEPVIKEGKVISYKLAWEESFQQTRWLERCKRTPLNLNQAGDLWDYLPALDF